MKVFYEADDGTNPAIPAVEQQAQAPAQEPETPKYTDKQMNDIVAKNSAKEASRILKEAGLETTGNLKDDVAKFKAWKESQMSEAEKYKAQLADRDNKDAESRKEADGIRAENEALKKGVPADKVARVVKLAVSGVYEGDTMTDRVAAVLADFPEYIKEPSKNIGAESKGQAMNAEADLLARARKQAGLA